MNMWTATMLEFRAVPVIFYFKFGNQNLFDKRFGSMLKEVSCKTRVFNNILSSSVRFSCSVEGIEGGKVIVQHVSHFGLLEINYTQGHKKSGPIFSTVSIRCICRPQIGFIRKNMVPLCAIALLFVAVFISLC